MNLYEVENGYFGITTFVIAENEKQAKELASAELESYAKRGRWRVMGALVDDKPLYPKKFWGGKGKRNLVCTLMHENTEMPGAYIIEFA